MAVSLCDGPWRANGVRYQAASRKSSSSSGGSSSSSQRREQPSPPAGPCGSCLLVRGAPRTTRSLGRAGVGQGHGLVLNAASGLIASPPKAEPPVLSLLPNLGTLAGPLAVGSVAGHYSLNVASQFVSLLLAACALGYALFGLETLHAPHARRAVPGSSVELRVARAG